MDTLQIIGNELNYFSYYPTVFSTRMLLDCAPEKLDCSMTREVLLNDPRVLCIHKSYSHEEGFISRNSLIRWLALLNTRLAREGLSRLEKVTLARFMNNLGFDKDISSPPAEIVQFAKTFGLIVPVSELYIFPVARLIISVRGRATGNTVDLIIDSTQGLDTAIEPYMENLIDSTLSQIDRKAAYILRAREGIFRKAPLTLKKLGRLLGYTRERIRQIHNAGMRQQCLLRPFLTGMLQTVMKSQGSLLYDSLFELTCFLRCFSKCLGIPFVDLKEIDLTVFGFNHTELPAFKWPVCFPDKSCTVEWLESCHLSLSDTDIATLADRFTTRWRTKLTITKKLYFALQRIRRPTHYSEICRVYNSLFSKHPGSEHSIHVALGREKDGIVWVGSKGMFALEEWGYKHPSKSLHDTVTEIVAKQYAFTNKPVPFELIVVELGKYRQYVNPKSLNFVITSNTAIQTLSGNSFIPKTYSERQKHDSSDKLDEILEDLEKNV